MLEDLLPLAAAVMIGANCYFLGALTTRRRYQRENAATAQCAACDWKSDPVPLAAAFTAAARHTATPAASATERHRGFVVKA